MLTLIVPSVEGWDSKKEEFVALRPEVKLQLEHSLVSVAKWESKWCKPFLGKGEKTDEEILDYIKCMTITQNVNPEVYERLTHDNIKAINTYINAPMTASTVAEDKNGKVNREVVTSEIIYHWMMELNIWPECQKWHLNRLLMLVKVRNAKLAPPKKKSIGERLMSNAALNAARRKKLNSKG